MLTNLSHCGTIVWYRNGASKIDRKEENGAVVKWQIADSLPRLSKDPKSYVTRESFLRNTMNRGAAVVRNLPAWMQELEQQTKPVREKPTSVIAEKASNPHPSQKKASAK
jgi:ethanolamine utilization cobalamin adenosyltransferase